MNRLEEERHTNERNTKKAERNRKKMGENKMKKKTEERAERGGEVPRIRN